MSVDQHPDRYAVFGSPIQHSKSPRIHALFAQQCGQNLEYTAKLVGAEAFNDAVSAFFAEGGKGLNCTLPLKELAWQYADSLTPRAESAKAVNTLAIQPDGTVLGDNTDGCGLIQDLTVNHGIQIQGARVVILGAGGATRGILAPILALAPEALLISNRTADKAVKLADEFAGQGRIEGGGFEALEKRSFDLIINATAASLADDLPPLPTGLLKEGGYCYDLAYANQATAFVRWGRQHGAVKALDGLGMLVEQAAEAFYLWRSVRPDTAPVIALLDAERGQI
jgi:shikimate dehydrogenase